MQVWNISKTLLLQIEQTGLFYCLKPPSEILGTDIVRRYVYVARRGEKKEFSRKRETIRVGQKVAGPIRSRSEAHFSTNLVFFRWKLPKNGFLALESGQEMTYQ